MSPKTIMDPEMHDSQSPEPEGDDQFFAKDYFLLRNAKTTFSEFVKTRFIPEYVSLRCTAGKAHYRAMMKHILNPGMVDAFFDEGSGGPKGRLKAVHGWPYLDDVRLHELSVHHVEAIVSAALEKGYSVQTVKHIRNVLGVIVTHAMNRRCFIGENPAFQVPLPKMIRRPAWQFTSMHVKRVLNRMRDPERKIAVVAMHTGLTLAEICSLQWKQVNITEYPGRLQKHFLPPRTIAIQRQANRVRFQEPERIRTKNVHISELLVAMLRNLKSRKLRSNPDDFVFSSPSGAELTPYDLTNRLLEIGNELEMPWLSWCLFTKASAYLARAAELGFHIEMPARMFD